MSGSARGRNPAFDKNHRSGKHMPMSGRDIEFEVYEAIQKLRSPFLAKSIAALAKMGDRTVARHLTNYTRNGLLRRQPYNHGYRYWSVEEKLQSHRPAFSPGLVLSAVWGALSIGSARVKKYIEVVSEAVAELLERRGGDDATTRDIVATNKAVAREITALLLTGKVIKVGKNSIRIHPHTRSCPVMSNGQKKTTSASSSGSIAV